MLVGSAARTGRRRRTLVGVAAMVAVAVASVLYAPSAAAEPDDGPGRIKLSWAEPVDVHSVWVGWFWGEPEADSYVVRSLPSGATCATVQPGCRIDGLVDEVRHEFVIESTNASGTRTDPVRSFFIPNRVEVPSGRVTEGRTAHLPITVRLDGPVDVTLNASGGTFATVGGTGPAAGMSGYSSIRLSGAPSAPQHDTRVEVLWKAPFQPGDYTLSVTARTRDNTYSAGVATMTVQSVGGARILSAPPPLPTTPPTPATPPPTTTSSTPHLGFPIAQTKPVAAEASPVTASTEPAEADWGGVLTFAAAAAVIAGAALMVLVQRRRTA